jgi:RNA polymerase sigma factor (sigma-70 family)
MEESEEPRWERLIALLDPIHRSVLATARRLCRSPGEGDDLYQEAVLRAFRKLPSLRDESRFRSWFFAVLLSVHRSRSRRSFWRRFRPLDEARTEVSEIPIEGGRAGEELERANRVTRALATLPAVQREAVVLFEIEGHSIEEIAARQNASASAVKSRLARGRARLRRHYQRLGWPGLGNHPAREMLTVAPDSAAPASPEPAESRGEPRRSEVSRAADPSTDPEPAESATVPQHAGSATVPDHAESAAAPEQERPATHRKQPGDSRQSKHPAAPHRLRQAIRYRSS